MIHLGNPGMAPLAELPAEPWPELKRQVLDEASRGGRLSAVFGLREGPGVRVFVVLSLPDQGRLAAASSLIEGAFESLTSPWPAAQWFERALWEETLLVPTGHPWLKPVRFPGGAAGVQDYFRVEGEEIHEVAVGPVHAGIIEPGHFRLQCHGEEVLNLEISLGYQHRGVEKALVGGPNARSVYLMETLAGDTTAAHTTAYAMVIEVLSSCSVGPRVDALRAVGVELERLANHVGDLGALAGDVGYLPTASYCGRLRGDVLNTTAWLCGSRFGRGFVVPGGLRFDVDTARAETIMRRLTTLLDELTPAVDLLWNSSSVQARFERAGTVTSALARRLGLVGPVARATGLEVDVRYELPYGPYRFAQVPISTASTGDVLARAQVRWSETQRSAEFASMLLDELPEGPSRVIPGELAPKALAVSLVEGWRGEICHVAVTDESGRFARYKVFDPSCHNWMGLAMALRGQPISDFPLCNKSFNLSYCGHDL